MVKQSLLFGAGVALGLAIPLTTRIEPQDQGQSVNEFPDLGKGLTETPGCLGVQSFTLNGNRTFVLAAWFENRKAVEAWYYGKMHQDAMRKFFPTFKGGKPFAEFKDEKAPILVVASVTPGDKPVGHGSKLAVSQIAIEGYTPIPGGLAVGGSFAPEKLQVPGLRRLPAGQ